MADLSQRITSNLTDMPAMGGMMAMAGAFGGESESQSADGYEKTYVRDGQRTREKWNNRTNRGEYGIVVGDRFQVEAEGQAESIDQLKDMVGSLDLKGLVASKAAGAPRPQWRGAPERPGGSFENGKGGVKGE